MDSHRQLLVIAFNVSRTGCIQCVCGIANILKTAMAKIRRNSFTGGLHLREELEGSVKNVQRDLQDLKVHTAFYIT